MNTKVKSIRTFIGSANYQMARSFYMDLGFEEVKLSDKMSFFNWENIGFYLQDYYVKEWVDNSMLFLEVENLETVHSQVKELRLDQKYRGVRLSDIESRSWGREFFLHDPSGVLWHIGEFE